MHTQTRSNPDPPFMRYYCECHAPAMGHVFGALTLTCECGKEWGSHQREPVVCRLFKRRLARQGGAAEYHPGGLRRIARRSG
jgi:hypothetical protein